MQAILLTIALVVFSATAFAACVNPAMPEGGIFYNSDFDTMQYCSDTEWVTLDGLGIYCAQGEGIVMTSTGWVCSP